MITLSHVTKTYDGHDVVSELSFSVEKGGFCALIGASGSGKSTTLRMLNRLVEPDGGRIDFAGQDITRQSPEQLRRRMGYVIQSVGLFPHWTVARNIATVPALLGWPKARIAARIAELMALLRLDPALGRAMPRALSGGQAQRVGVARALAADPELLLMDEPFGALDPITRTAAQDELTRIHRSTGKTIIMVTHDMDEALRLASQIVLMEHGRLVQAGTPADLLLRPADARVRDFVGHEDHGLKRLGLLSAGDRAQPGEAQGVPIPAETSCRAALSMMIDRKVDRLPLEDGRVLHLAALVR